MASFEDRLKQRSENLRRNVERAVRRAATLIDTTLVVSTPVKTGRARANWLASINRPRTDMPGPADAKAALGRNQNVFKLFKAGQTIVIANNLPYIRKLNAGHSQQAPAGFVEKAVTRGRRSLATSRRYLDRPRKGD